MNSRSGGMVVRTQQNSLLHFIFIPTSAFKRSYLSPQFHATVQSTLLWSCAHHVYRKIHSLVTTVFNILSATFSLNAFAKEYPYKIMLSPPLISFLHCQPCLQHHLMGAQTKTGQKTTLLKKYDVLENGTTLKIQYCLATFT